MSNKFNKTDLIKRIAEDNKVSKAEAERAINYTLGGIKALLGEMKPEDRLQLVGNMTMEVVHREQREGHNPRKPSEKITIPAKNVVKIKAGAEFLEAVE